MNNIESKIKAIFEANPGGFSSLNISIECPLDSGVTVKASAVRGQERVEPVLGGVKEFFLFVQDYRKSHPSALFNRITIRVDNLQNICLAYEYDEKLQNETMDNIK